MDHEIADWNNYLENQSKQTPIFFERDGSIFIAPDPRTDEIGTNRLRITGIRSIASGSWTTATTESEIKLPITFFDVIRLGLIARIHASCARDENLIQSATNRYEAKRDQAIANMFTEQPFINEFPR